MRVSVSSCLFSSFVHRTFFKSQHRPQVCLWLFYWRVRKNNCTLNSNLCEYEKVIEKGLLLQWKFLCSWMFPLNITVRRMWISSSNPKTLTKREPKTVFSLGYVNSLLSISQLVFEDAFLFILLFWLCTSLEGIIQFTIGRMNVAYYSCMCFYILKIGNVLYIRLGRIFFILYIFKYL